MKIIDLTHVLEEGMPVYPGTEPPVLAEANTIDRDGFREKKMTMYSHTGTHMDAPAHIFSGSDTLDQMPVETFFGSACVLDLPIFNLAAHGETLAASDFVLLRSRWSRHWGTEKYSDSYPVLDEITAKRLLGYRLKGIGVDAISVDPMDSVSLPIHRILLGTGHVIIENLTNLDLLPADGFKFSCFPLKIRDADGSPVRAVAQFL